MSIISKSSLNDPFIFLLDCKYTTTRSDKFSFDDLGVGLILADSIPPQIIDVETHTEKSLTVICKTYLQTFNLYWCSFLFGQRTLEKLTAVGKLYLFDACFFILTQFVR